MTTDPIKQAAAVMDRVWAEHQEAHEAWSKDTDPVTLKDYPRSPTNLDIAQALADAGLLPTEPAPTVKPSRDDVARAIYDTSPHYVPDGPPWVPIPFDDPDAFSRGPGSHIGGIYAAADAVLALLPGVTEREAKAAAWDQGFHHGRRRIAAHPSENPYRDEVERGEGRG